MISDITRAALLLLKLLPTVDLFMMNQRLNISAFSHYSSAMNRGWETSGMIGETRAGSHFWLLYVKSLALKGERYWGNLYFQFRFPMLHNKSGQKHVFRTFCTSLSPTRLTIQPQGESRCEFRPTCMRYLRLRPTDCCPSFFCRRLLCLSFLRSFLPNSSSSSLSHFCRRGL